MSAVRGWKENFRIVVEPRDMGDFGGVSISTGLLYGHGDDGRKRLERETEERCEEIARDIRRHVDNVSRNGVRVLFDQEDVCEHCGSKWTEDSREYNGGCCDKDEGAQERREEDAANNAATKP